MVSDNQNYPSYGGGDPYQNQGGDSGGYGGYGGGQGYGGGGGYPPQGPKPDNYLVWSILTTLLCCLPAGVVSIVYAAKVDGLWNSGQFTEAQTASDNAKKWAMISAGVGIAFIVLYIIFVVAIGVGTAGSM